MARGCRIVFTFSNEPMYLHTGMMGIVIYPIPVFKSHVCD